jgi:hypothetical protein
LRSNYSSLLGERANGATNWRHKLKIMDSVQQRLRIPEFLLMPKYMVLWSPRDCNDAGIAIEVLNVKEVIHV